MQNVSFEVFEGPLDLLLSLIAKNEIDVFDIPMALVTRQYMEHIYTAGMLDIELATEFIVVASQLIEIKSQMMLPPEEDEQGETPPDPRQELAERIAQYRVFKAISEYMKNKQTAYYSMIEKESEYFPSLKEEYAPIDAAMLTAALKRLLLRFDTANLEYEEYTVAADELAVADAIEMVREILKKERKASFLALFGQRPSRGRIISVFLAVLEMVKENEIEITQEGLYGDIRITVV